MKQTGGQSMASKASIMLAIVRPPRLDISFPSNRRRCLVDQLRHRTLARDLVAQMIAETRPA